MPIPSALTKTISARQTRSCTVLRSRTNLSESAVGHERKNAEPRATLEAGGKADIGRAKADITAERSAVGGRAVVSAAARIGRD